MIYFSDTYSKHSNCPKMKASSSSDELIAKWKEQYLREKAERENMENVLKEYEETMRTMMGELANCFFLCVVLFLFPLLFLTALCRAASGSREGEHRE